MTRQKSGLNSEIQSLK